MIRVWFNHWFSTSYRLIELMKQDKQEEIYVIATNQVMDSVIQKVCDEWYEDPIMDGEAYVQFCLDFCVEHKIDVFVPRKKMVEISENKQRFTDIGVKVLVDDYEKMHLLNDKVATYDYLKDCASVNIPPYRMVNTADEFEKAYAELKQECDKVCVKFVCDEGAKSYRTIVENVDSFEKLREYAGAQITYEDYVAALRQVDRFDDLMVMAYCPEMKSAWTA